MTTIRRKILIPFLMLIILIATILMLAVSLSVSFFSEEWAKKDLSQVASNISTSLRGEEKDLNRLIPLINSTKGSSTVEVIVYNLPKRMSGFAYSDDTFVTNEIKAQAFNESLNLPLGTVGSFSMDGDNYYIVEIEQNDSAPLNKVIYISKGLPLDNLVTNINLVMFICTLITTFVAILVTRGLSNSIAKPIEHVTNCIEKMKSDDLLVISEKSDSIELRRLIIGFNEMSRRIYQFQQSQSLFLNNASHELRTPLMSIQGYADGIEMGIFHDYKETAHLISEQSKRLTKLVEGLLTLARAENFRENKSLEKLNLSNSLYEILNGYKGYAIKNNVEIQVEITSNIFVNANDELLTGSVGNIISNAIRYAKSTVHITLKEEHKKAIITISDDGIGISNIDTAFQRFSKGEGGNFGLGLSIAKASVDAMNGEIRAYNNNGAVFEIQLSLN